LDKATYFVSGFIILYRMINAQRNLLFFYLILLVLYSCKSRQQQKVATNSTVPGPANIIELDTRLQQADSVVLIFYRDPFGPDSLRYTRFYSQYNDADSGIVFSLKRNLQQAFTRLEKIKDCRSEGKIWVFSKGKIFQTVYFAFQKPACKFLYVIKDGWFYYVDVQPSFIDQLLQLKPLAKEIESNSEE
jgi:hypothetical protein